MLFSIDSETLFSILKAIGMVLLLIASRNIMHSMAIGEVDGYILDYLESEAKLDKDQRLVLTKIRENHTKADRITASNYRWMMLAWAMYLVSAIFTIFASGRLI